MGLGSPMTSIQLDMQINSSVLTPWKLQMSESACLFVSLYLYNGSIIWLDVMMWGCTYRLISLQHQEKKKSIHTKGHLNIDRQNIPLNLNTQCEDAEIQLV